MSTRHFQMFAHYNRWANRTLYDAAAALTADEFARDVGAFFGSMCGTLNHLVVADRIWMRRFTGKGPEHRKLDDVPYLEFDALGKARKAEDERIVAFAEGLDEARLAGKFTYTPITIPEPITLPLAPMLAHLFNHQTHHRGQAHTILSLLAKAPPPLDLIYFLRTQEGQPFA